MFQQDGLQSQRTSGRSVVCTSETGKQNQLLVQGSTFTLELPPLKGIPGTHHADTHLSANEALLGNT